MQELSAPAETVTDPAGVPLDEATVTRTWTGWPTVEGSGWSDVMVVVVAIGPGVRTT